MYQDRLSKLAEQARVHEFDMLALVPGPNLFYLTGLSFHLSERPIVAFFPVDGPPALVAPGFEAIKVEKTGLEMQVFAYTDEQGYEPAFEKARAALKLDERVVGAEAFNMRLVEVRLLEGCAIVPAEDALAALRMCKDAHELEQMRRAIVITETALRATAQQIKAGMSELEVAALLRAEILQGGGQSVSFAVVQGGPNAASPHAGPSERLIQPADTIVIDVGATVGGYNSDITRTFAIGSLDPELARVYEAVKASNEAGRAAVRPGVAAQDVDRAARAVIEQAGYGEYFIHRTGHGLGLEGHEPPYIVEGNELILEQGMTFTVEPGIYLPGRGGVRIEDDVVVTADGGESLTTFPRQFMAL